MVGKKGVEKGIRYAHINWVLQEFFNSKNALDCDATRKAVLDRLEI